MNDYNIGFEAPAIDSEMSEEGTEDQTLEQRIEDIEDNVDTLKELLTVAEYKAALADDFEKECAAVEKSNETLAQELVDTRKHFKHREAMLKRPHASELKAKDKQLESQDQDLKAITQDLVLKNRRVQDLKNKLDLVHRPQLTPLAPAVQEPVVDTQALIENLEKELNELKLANKELKKDKDVESESEDEDKSQKEPPRKRKRGSNKNKERRLVQGDEVGGMGKILMAGGLESIWIGSGMDSLHELHASAFASSFASSV